MTGTASLDHRTLVEQASRRRRGYVYAALVLDQATSLLADWCASAQRHGADLTTHQEGKWADRIAAQALEMLSDYQPNPTFEESKTIEEKLQERLWERRIEYSGDIALVTLPRTSETPDWDSRGRELTLLIDAETGWNFLLWKPGTGPYESPRINAVTPCDANSIDAVIDLALDVNHGRYGNPFAPE